MRHSTLAAFTLAIISTTALVPGVALAQTGEVQKLENEVLIAAEGAGTKIYPIDRARLLSGGKFDLKVEFPTVVKESDITLTLNDKPFAEVFDEKAEYIENENGKDGSSLVIKQVSLVEPGAYTVVAEGKDAAGKTFRSSVKWDVSGTPKEARAKNIIFILGDGMTVSMRTGARIMSKGNTEGKANGKLNMDTLPAMAFIGTSSTDSIAADSANTMSAYMTGQKSAVNALGVYATRNENSLDQPRQETIAEAIRRMAPKKAIGIVSNAELQDATPAAVVSHTRRRADKPEIVGMFYDVQPEIILGGGSAYFLPKSTPGSKRKDDIDYIEKFREAGYAVATDRDELTKVAAETNSGKVLGLFSTGNMEGTVNMQLGLGDAKKFPNQPSVPEMMESALSVLEKNEDGFFLMVEGALIDKYEHPLDFDRAIVETITLDKAVGIAQEFAKKHPDTLIITTADHTHGVSIIGTIDRNFTPEEQKVLELNENAQVEGAGSIERASPMRQRVGTYQNGGFPDYKDTDGDGYPDTIDVKRPLAVFANNYPDYYETFGPKMDGTFVPALKNEKGEYVANEAYKNVPGAVLRIGNIPTSEDTGVHAVDDVVLQAQGPGSEKLHGYMENSDVFFVLADVFSLGEAKTDE
ncbi:alkaline phosphatase [Pseudochelatococcus contaminans]|uniref:Alkaline phosphatase n=1 Tax=Pseudochelatococcus contaminans TaxID=1538103 RepID=A0A7W5Z3C6_9HYPH|nr:alkaline phosphatase [Pseudochelatococcus contaminans]MBB3809378.1 alkaline phosphatase [Pseudochelatococcus contaminans]